jgi:hypothetical protein
MRRNIILGFLFALIIGCTSNPFFSDEIKTNEKLSFSGNVKLPYTNNHSDIHVYVEGLDVLTKTDRNGDFTIKMPVEPGLQPGQGLTAFYNVYYYVANYEITFSSIFVNKGEFAFGVADLDNNGLISKKIVLRQLLDVTTIVNPEQIKQNYTDPMTITVRLENKVDSVIVFSNFIDENRFASAFLTDKDSPDDNVYLIDHPSSSIKSVVIDSTMFWTMDVNWSVDGNNVNVGSYNVIPYIYVFQRDIPSGLFKKLGSNVTWFTKDYLKLPFRRQSAELNIEWDSD